MIGGVAGSFTFYAIYAIINEHKDFHYDFNAYRYFEVAKYGFYVGGCIGFMREYFKKIEN